MQLFDALELKDGEMVCFVGAGGKTGLMLRLASECASRDRRVLVTTSTRMYIRQLQNCGQLVLEQDEGKLLGRLDDARRRVPACGRGGWVVAAGAGLTEEGKVVGLGREALDAIHGAGLFDSILVEADGARGKPLKAPAPHEPVLPSRADCVVAVVGADALGSPLTEQYVHRWRLAAEAAGQDTGSAVTGTTILKIVTCYRDLARQAAPGCRFIPAVNKADKQELLGKAREIAGRLSQSMERVLVTSTVLGDPVLEVLR
ncbi:MAG: selenium cofactor biosynthesis protein YqeC [Thermacetogeniaceae bacterium]